jgi:magnesium chelatase family protein
MACSCSQASIIKYQRKISGPILDRIDLHVEVPRIKFEKLNEDSPAESSAAVRTRVQTARNIQKTRFAGSKTVTNGEMTSAQIKSFCALTQASSELMRMAVSRFYLSARAYYRIIKVARTIADLEGIAEIQPTHIAEAIQYRFKTE